MWLVLLVAIFGRDQLIIVRLIADIATVAPPIITVHGTWIATLVSANGRLELTSAAMVAPAAPPSVHLRAQRQLIVDPRIVRPSRIEVGWQKAMPTPRKVSRAWLSSWLIASTWAFFDALQIYAKSRCFQNGLEAPDFQHRQHSEFVCRDKNLADRRLRPPQNPLPASLPRNRRQVGSEQKVLSGF